ncbi:MAG: DUF1343 domain-containing protein [Bacteroidetes bacterium]|nr:MAG: DUF1343 domain-containing protein [Bacteroidota bacterium]
MKRYLTHRNLVSILLLFVMLVGAQSQVKTGIEVLAENDFDLLQGKRVGLVTNPTGVDGSLRSTIDILHAHVNLTALFGPEHGVRGDFSAGDHVGDMVDALTGIPVFSLYGSNRKPSKESLKNIDVLVYDIQDIGVRSYTYISTMGLVMEAAAEMDKEVIVLDRPNPLGGIRIEGPLVEDGFHSFVSQYSIPYVYGLTCGELALMLNGEGMLEGGKRCKLQVVPMEGWHREMTFGECGLPWVPTSPHIPDYHTAYFYPATGIIGELDPNMIGIGYTLPFQLLATENIDAQLLSDAMNALKIDGVAFRPIWFKPYYMAKKGTPLQGVQIHLTDPLRAPLTSIQFWFLQEAHKLDPSFDPFKGKEDRYRMFDMVCGSDRLRTSIMSNFSFKEIQEYWNRDVDQFRERSIPYYLYK